MFGAESGWVEALTSCDHLGSSSSDLVHIPTPDTPCNRLAKHSEQRNLIPFIHFRGN